MSLLTVNDRPGEYPGSWYAASAEPLAPFPALEGQRRADVCVIGGGFTGLTAALALAEAGREVVLIEAQRVGFGASGRNGGQVGTGHRQDQDVLERRHGFAAAKALWDLSVAAQDEVRRLIAKHHIDAAWRDGVAWAEWTAKGADETAAYAQDLRARYGAEGVEVLDRAAIRRLIGSEAFEGGAIDWKAGHIHPLRFALGLARAAHEAGAAIHERSLVTRIDPERGLVETDAGAVQADAVVMACNGYHGGLSAKVAQRVMPINNFIVATEPLGARAAEILSQDIAVADSKFVVNYWRLSEDRRLLFGGSESYGDRFPSDIRGAVRGPMLEIYPQLEGVALDYAWGGTLGITPTRMPYFAKLGAKSWSASGYSGHGVGLATLAGRLLAEAIEGDAKRFDTMAIANPPAFPGLSLTRRPLLSLAMRWFAFRDRFQR